MAAMGIGVFPSFLDGNDRCVILLDDRMFDVKITDTIPSI